MLNLEMNFVFATLFWVARRFQVFVANFNRIQHSFLHPTQDGFLVRRDAEEFAQGLARVKSYNLQIVSQCWLFQNLAKYSHTFLRSCHDLAENTLKADIPMPECRNRAEVNTDPTCLVRPHGTIYLCLKMNQCPSETLPWLRPLPAGIPKCFA